MARHVLALTVAAAAVALAGVAGAQPYGRPGGGGRPVATLYEGYNFEGRRVEVFASEGNLSNIGFNDRARSARFEGQWRICENASYGGRCQDVQGEVADLNRIGMAERISSLQAYDGGYGGGQSGGGYGGGYNNGGYGGSGGGWSGQGRGTEGERTVFFPYPKIDGTDVAAGDMSANAFCRSKGLNGVAFYDSSQRAPYALDGERRPVRNTTIIRDLLCRKY